MSNYGWSLFNWIPLVCGNAAPEEERFGPVAFFRNDVTVDKIQGRFMSAAKKHGETVHDLAFHNYDTVMLYLPILNYPIPIPYVLCYREIQLSGSVK